MTSRLLDTLPDLVADVPDLDLMEEATQDEKHISPSPPCLPVAFLHTIAQS